MKKQQITPEKPIVGQTMKVWGVECKITRVWPAGTVDVLTLDGKHARRVTGLGFLSILLLALASCGQPKLIGTKHIGTLYHDSDSAEYYYERGDGSVFVIKVKE